MIVPVWVESWQLQCCGEVFTVGSLVRWFLTTDTNDFLRQALGSRPPAWSAVLPVLNPLLITDAGAGCVVGRDGLHVFVSLPAGPSAGPELQAGVLREDHHGDIPDGVPPTIGTVRTISLARFAYALDQDRRAMFPVPGEAELERTATAEKFPRETVDGREFAGYLVGLDVQEDPGT